MKAAGRDIEAKKQQELRGKKAQRKVSLQRRVCDIWDQARFWNPGQGQRDRKDSNIPSSQREPLGFRAHLKDTRTLNNLVCNLFSAEERKAESMLQGCELGF